MKASSSTGSSSSQGLQRENKSHLRKLERLPCCKCGRNPAGVAHHTTHHQDRGMSRKAPDWAAMPLCPTCHASIHSIVFGPFKGWTREMLRAWQDDMIEVYRPQNEM